MQALDWEKGNHLGALLGLQQWFALNSGTGDNYSMVLISQLYITVSLLSCLPKLPRMVDKTQFCPFIL